ncbi:MAG: type III-A CRISPR-associated RAMP protein Csm4 [bacterium]
MDMYRFQLNFISPVHFGEIGIGLENTNERLFSDTLTSALINAFSILGGADDVVRALCSADPPFILSSLFPFGPDKETNNPCYMLPRPLKGPKVDSPEDLRPLSKDIKKIKYLLMEDFLRWIDDSPLKADEISEIIERNKKISEGWRLPELRPRVAIDRVHNNSHIWYCGTLKFAHHAGLYGLAYITDQNWKKRLTEAFHCLGDMGLGGERTYGLGSFHFGGFEMLKQDMNPQPNSHENKKSILLSLYFPTDEERTHLPQRFEAWDIVERKGYIVSGRNATGTKRRRVWMFTEGSVLKSTIKGCMIDVTPENLNKTDSIQHPVFRAGLAFLFPSGGVI